MESYPRWKYLLVLFVLISAIIYALPNFYKSYPGIEISINDSKNIDNFKQDYSKYLINDNNKIWEKVKKKKEIKEDRVKQKKNEEIDGFKLLVTIVDMAIKVPIK